MHDFLTHLMTQTLKFQSVDLEDRKAEVWALPSSSCLHMGQLLTSLDLSFPIRTEESKLVSMMLWCRFNKENSIEACVLSRVKQITSPGWMHETSAQTWCTGKT